MTKIAFIGAGSGFGQRISADILAHPEFQDCTISLVDISETNLAGVHGYVQELIERYNLPAKVEATADRRSVLEGADYVVIAVAIGGPAYDGVPYYHEVKIPAKYGVSQSVADTCSIGAIFRMLRTGPEMLRIAQDIGELCPDAWVLNYTNPMSMLCWMMNEGARIKMVGLCHSVQGTAHQLAGYMGVPAAEVDYWVAGINHMSWFLELRRRGGEDLYPRLREVAEDPEIYKHDTVRFEVFKHFGYFVTESTPHMSEYVPYFRKTKELRDAFSLYESNPNPVAAEDRRHDWFEEIRKQLKDADPSAGLQPSAEYASHIMRALHTGIPFRFNGNVPNRGIISNLSPECCVEVPCLTDATGVRPCFVGEIPPQLAALNMSNIAVHRLTVEAVLERSKQKAYYASILDPLSATQCTLGQIKEMFEELWAADAPWLTEYGA
jgi:alpha-galactosidase